MATLTIRTSKGDSVSFSAIFGIWKEKIKMDTLVQNIEKNGLTEKDVVSLTIVSDQIEVDWGKQFSSFPWLTEVIMIAEETIRLNCYNFSGSMIRTVRLRANELWFNDGAFCDAKELEFVSCEGKILNGNNDGLTEMLFMNCPNLKAIHGVYRGERLMPYVFTGCTSLEKPLDFYVKELGYCTFMDCVNLKRIHLHNGLISLGYSAFKNCISLEDVYVPDSVASLGTETFAGCKKLKSIYLPNSLSRIPSGTFADCIELNKVFLSDDITEIGDEAFRGCSSLCRPWFPAKLKSIGSRAFYGCKSIKKIFLPESVSEIGEDAFLECGDLIICGNSGSYAEQYAEENGLVFIVE